MAENRLIHGIAVQMKDGSVLRIPTIPFTDEGFELAEKMDSLSDSACSNRSIMKLMLAVCIRGVRLNYPKMSANELAAKLDIETANSILAALRGEVEEV